MIDKSGLPFRQKTAGFSSAQTEPDWTKALIEITKSLKLNEFPEIAELVKKIAITGNQTAAKKWVKRLASAYYEQKLTPNNFLSAENNLNGEILLGYTEDGKPFGLSRDELVRHTGIFGQSGSGKSNLIKFLFVQAKQHGIHTVHFDRKGDLEHSAREGIDSIYWARWRVNPLCPPDTNVNIYEWRNDFVKAFSELMQFFQRGSSVFLQGVDTLYRNFRIYERWPAWDWNTMVFPTLADLLALFKSTDFRKRIRGQGTESLLSIIDKLESLVIELKPIVSCQKGFDIRTLNREKTAINYNLDGLSVEYQNFLIIAEILRYAHFFRTYGPRNQLNALFIFDEAKGIVGKANQDKFIVKDLVSKIREWGIGLICADQIPSEISQFFFSNIGTLIFFRHSDGFDLQRLRYSSGATVEQMLDNYSLKPGEAIVRSMKCKDLHKIKVPFEPVEKFISREEVDRLMAPRLEELNRDVILELSKSNKDAGDVAKQKAATILDEEESHFLECLAKDFDRPSTEVYRELGLNESAGFRLKKRLLVKRYITEVSTNLGKDGKRAVFLVPNPIAFTELGVALGPGRGKALHKHFQAELKAQAEQLGYIATIEPCTNGTSEGPDLGLEKNGLRIAVEISVTSKPSQEASNVEKNLRLGFSPVVLTFVNRDMLEKTKELITSQYQDLNEKVKLCMVNQFASILQA